MGRTKERLQRGFASVFPRRGIVLLPEEETSRLLVEEAEKRKSRLVPVPTIPEKEIKRVFPTAYGREFLQNLRLVHAAAGVLQVDEKAIRKGEARTIPDFGALRFWSFERGRGRECYYCANGFSGNDPLSTELIFQKIMEKPFFRNLPKIGLLNLRGDRGDRTLQWIHALREKKLFGFNKIYVIGDQARLFQKKLCARDVHVEALMSESPADITETCFSGFEGKALLIGMGNLGGLGRTVVEYWEKTGQRNDL
jgi:hypothetical protein